MIATKEQRIATIGTAVFCILFLLMLVLVRFINDPTEEEEGVLVNFGDTEQGMGEVEPRPAMAQAIPTPPTPSESAPSEANPEPQQSGEEDVVNQDFEESAVIEQKKKKKREDDELKRRQEEVKRQQELEQQRLAEEQRRQEEERKRQEEIQRQQQQQMEAAQNKAKNAFAGRNPNGGNTGEGTTGQPGNQGSLNGDINSTNRLGNGGGNGINFSLAGRSFGSTPPPPEDKGKEDGKVVVEIRVDRNGNVVSASPGKKGSNITDQAVLKACKEAALKAKFNSDPNAPEIQTGTITYVFVF